MTDFARNSDEYGSRSAPAGEDLLPPVEPPSAGFIIQLFVVPALIVIAIVLLWLSFNWLVRRTTSDPRELVEGLDQGPAVARWQRASELANVLGSERFADFKLSSESAARLAQILEREIDQASMDENDVEFRNFITRALGEFSVQEGTDVLLKAAETNRDAREQKVRDGALQSIAKRAYNLQRLDPPQTLAHPELEPTLLRLAASEDAAIRFQTAYVLGQLGTAAAIEQLELMVGDPDMDTRYNAAIALAHRGNPAAVETLAEMLDIDEMARAGKKSDDEPARSDRRVFVQSAMEAAKVIASQNPDADLSPMIEALKRIVDAKPQLLDEARLPAPAVAEARRTLKALKARSTTQAAQ